MRILKATIEGEKAGLHQPYAEIYRDGTGLHVAVFEGTVQSDNGALRRVIEDTGDENDVFSMAQLLQFELDGYEGTNSDVHQYFDFLNSMLSY